MISEDLLRATDALGWVVGRLIELPEAQLDALSAATACTLARVVLVELAEGIHAGMDPYDALVRSAKTRLSLSQAHAQAFQVLATRLDGHEAAPDRS